MTLAIAGRITVVIPHRRRARANLRTACKCDRAALTPNPPRRMSHPPHPAIECAPCEPAVTRPRILSE